MKTIFKLSGCADILIDVFVALVVIGVIPISWLRFTGRDLVLRLLSVALALDFLILVVVWVIIRFANEAVKEERALSGKEVGS